MIKVDDVQVFARTALGTDDEMGHGGGDGCESFRLVLLLVTCA